MKKSFLGLALMAVLGIGGAFAGNVKKSALENPVFDKNGCVEITLCTTEPIGPSCAVPAELYVLDDCNTPTPAYYR